MQSVVVLGPPPAEVEELIERRHRLGLDLYDEVWEGTYHMSPGPHADHGYLDDELASVLRPLAKAVGLVPYGPLNIGEDAHNYRVPDRALLRGQVHSTFVATAAAVVEILSPDDETFEKFSFYAARGVEEIFVVDGQKRGVRIFSLVEGAYDETGRSRLLDVSSSDLEAAVDWPE